MDGATCYTLNSKMAIYQNYRVGNEVARQFDPNYNPPLIDKDNFRKSSCGPIESFGFPSVKCEGERTTFIYTPYFEDRLFDTLDGNIMLGRVLLHLANNWWKKIANGSQFPSKTASGDGQSMRIIKLTDITMWGKRIKEIESMLRRFPKEEGQMEWAHHKLVDLKLAFGELFVDKLVSAERLDAFEDSLTFLNVDVAEQIHFMKQFQEGIQGLDVEPEPSSSRFSDPCIDHAAFAQTAPRQLCVQPINSQSSQNSLGNFCQ